MPRAVNGFSYPKEFCNGDCNNCDIHQNRQFSLLINILHQRFGDEVYQITEMVCPNMTCCADCHIDDFCHMEKCEILDEAEALVKEWSKKKDEQ